MRRLTFVAPAVGIVALLLSWNRDLSGAVVRRRLIGLFALTMFVAALTITPGRSTVMQGGVHLVLFVGFIVLSASP